MWLATSALATLAGPFGTSAALSDAMRMVYWGTVLAVAAPLAGVARGLTDRLLCPAEGEWSGNLVTALVFATLYAPCIYAFGLGVDAWGGDVRTPLLLLWESLLLASIALQAAQRLWHERARSAALRAAEGRVRNPQGARLPPAPVRRPAAARAVADPLVAGAGLALVAAPAPRTEGTAPEAAPAAEAEPVLTPRLMRRIEPRLRGAVVSLSVRDHYVVVVTERGQTSLLMRFADAVAEIDGIEGLRVHRSHWVAAGAVAGAVREKGRVFLDLQDGRRIPVSRSNQPLVLERWPL